MRAYALEFIGYLRRCRQIAYDSTTDLCDIVDAMISRTAELDSIERAFLNTLCEFIAGNEQHTSHGQLRERIDVFGNVPLRQTHAH